MMDISQEIFWIQQYNSISFFNGIQFCSMHQWDQLFRLLLSNGHDKVIPKDSTTKWSSVLAALSHIFSHIFIVFVYCTAFFAGRTWWSGEHVELTQNPTKKRWWCCISSACQDVFIPWATQCWRRTETCFHGGSLYVCGRVHSKRPVSMWRNCLWTVSSPHGRKWMVQIQSEHV